jgi:ATP-dependent RNA helicase SUPV3L1/SUV3
VNGDLSGLFDSAEWEAAGDLERLIDLSNPEAWYARARGLAREVIYHAGRTNSGKTHTALNHLAAAPTGIY